MAQNVKKKYDVLAAVRHAKAKQQNFNLLNVENKMQTESGLKFLTFFSQ